MFHPIASIYTSLPMLIPASVFLTISPPLLNYHLAFKTAQTKCSVFSHSGVLVHLRRLFQKVRSPWSLLQFPKVT